MQERYIGNESRHALGIDSAPAEKDRESRQNDKSSKPLLEKKDLSDLITILKKI